MVSYITTLKSSKHPELVLLDNKVFDGIAVANNYIISSKGYSEKAREVIISDLEEVDNDTFLNLVINNHSDVDPDILKSLRESVKISAVGIFLAKLREYL